LPEEDHSVETGEKKNWQRRLSESHNETESNTARLCSIGASFVSDP
jgi:hypothetical protein